MLQTDWQTPKLGLPALSGIDLSRAKKNTRSKALPPKDSSQVRDASTEAAGIAPADKLHQSSSSDASTDENYNEGLPIELVEIIVKKVVERERNSALRKLSFKHQSVGTLFDLSERWFKVIDLASMSMVAKDWHEAVRTVGWKAALANSF
jgi:hypothetical protein